MRMPSILGGSTAPVDSGSGAAKALKAAALVVGGLIGVTAGSAGISSLRRRIERSRDEGGAQPQS